MQFNSEANGLDLYSDTRYLCGLDETSDTASYPIKAFTRNANQALDHVLSLIFRSDNLWEFDDTNNTGELLDTSTALVSGTAKYALSVSWLKIGRVRIKDPNGNWITLTPVNRAQLNDALLTQTSGTPAEYDLLGNYLYLYPAPNYASTGGLEVQFQRGSSYFVNTDTTKTPGFATQFHRLIAYYAAMDYCDINGMLERSAALTSRTMAMEQELLTFYAQRDTDAKVTLSPAREDYGQLGLNPGSGSFPNGSSNNPRGW